MPPSTANSVRLLPLSIAMASRIAFVWKQAASMVARAMCPFCVCAVIPPMYVSSVNQMLSRLGAGLTNSSLSIVDPVRRK
jgi:hypothetical protein